MGVHDNSAASHDKLVASGKAQKRAVRILASLRVAGVPMTDRQLMALGYQDPNTVRPRITGLVQKGVLKEAGTVFDEETKRDVRLVAIGTGVLPAPRKGRPPAERRTQEEPD